MAETLPSIFFGHGQFDDFSRLRENKESLPQWACGAVGSALPWHGRGRRFDPDQVHHFFAFSEELAIQISENETFQALGA